MGRNNLVGAWGETIAAAYLRKKKYKLLAAGYRTRFGEIDLIASNRKNLIFVEVKLRKSGDFAEAREFVDFHKQARLRATAEMYLSRYPTKLQPRFDVIEVYAPQGVETKDPQINHLEGAFE
jgi:putative endonuclease